MSPTSMSETFLPLWPMRQIGFIYELEGQRRRVFLSGPNGDSAGYFVVIDKSYHAWLKKDNGVWRLEPNARNTIPFTDKDTQAFGRIIEHGVPTGMPVAFEINIWNQGRSHTVQVEMEQGREFETFQVFGRDTLVLRGNLPMLIAKGLKKKSVTWTLVSGQIHNSSVLENIQSELEMWGRDFHKQQGLPGE